eukprot:8686996-Pyramimonas_sp.AAC.1
MGRSLAIAAATASDAKVEMVVFSVEDLDDTLTRVRVVGRDFRRLDAAEGGRRGSRDLSLKYIDIPSPSLGP